MIIYRATNRINNKIYIGQTRDQLSQRANEHKNESISRRKKTYFNKAIIKHGFESFIWEEIDSADSIEELDYLEIYWIKWFRSNNRLYGYNLASGGRVNRGFKLTKEQSEAMSKRQKDEFASGKRVAWNKNKRLPHLCSRGNPNFGKRLTDEEKIKRSKIIQDRFDSGRFDEKRLNHSRIMSEKFKSGEMFRPFDGKKIRCVETQKVYDTIKQAAGEHDTSSSNIIAVLKGKRMTACGYKWEYVK